MSTAENLPPAPVRPAEREVVISTLLKRCAAGLILAYLCGASQPASAGYVVFSNLGPGNSYDTSTGYTIGNFGQGANYTYAAEFTTSSVAVRLTSLSVALGQVGATGGLVKISVASDIGGSPGAILESLQAAVPADFYAGGSLVTVNSILSPLLQANHQYWVEVSAVSSSDFFGWYFNSVGDTGSVGTSIDGGATYSVGPDTRGAFSVTGNVVPEPSSLVQLCSLAGIALAWGRLRHAKRQL